jgi:uncharacterized protein
MMSSGGLKVKRRKLAGGIMAFFILACCGVYFAGSILVAPHHRKVVLPPQLHAQQISLSSASGARLAAWLVIPNNPIGALVVLHGVHADRSAMVSRIALLSQNGYAVLAPDLQGHGESTGDHITYGYLESRDAECCIAFLKEKFPGSPIGGIGVSLGGAALVLANNRNQAQAIVLESVYTTIAEAAENRVARFTGPLSTVLTPLLLFQLKPRLGIGEDELRPIESIRALQCPLLVISGTADRHTTLSQTKALFAAANEPKELWLAPGAAHVDLLQFDREGYSTHVLGFLRHHLAQGN